MRVWRGQLIVGKHSVIRTEKNDLAQAVDDARTHGIGILRLRSGILTGKQCLGHILYDFACGVGIFGMGVVQFANADFVYHILISLAIHGEGYQRKERNEQT